MKLVSLLFMLPVVLMAQKRDATPPGGMSIFVSFLNKNVEFNEKVFEKDLSGQVLIEFRVNESGKLDSFNIVNDIGENAGLALVKAVKKGGDWIPAMEGNKPVASWIELPYNVLSNKQSENGAITNGLRSAEPEIGLNEFRKKFLNNFKYPDEAIKAGLQGTYTLKFIVKDDGNVTAIKLVDDPGYGLAESASRALRRSGKWKPITKDGEYLKGESTFEFMLSLKEFRRGIY